MTGRSLLGHLDGWRCHAHTGDTREEYRLPGLPVPLVQPGLARPPSGPVYCLSQRETGSQGQTESNDSGPRAGPPQVLQERGDRPRPAHQALKPLRHMPREGGSAPSRLASRGGSGSETPTQAALAFQP